MRHVKKKWKSYFRVGSSSRQLSNVSWVDPIAIPLLLITMIIIGRLYLQHGQWQDWDMKCILSISSLNIINWVTLRSPKCNTGDRYVRYVRIPWQYPQFTNPMHGWCLNIQSKFLREFYEKPIQAPHLQMVSTSMPEKPKALSPWRQIVRVFGLKSRHQRALAMAYPRPTPIVPYVPASSLKSPEIVPVVVLMCIHPSEKICIIATFSLARNLGT